MPTRATASRPASSPRSRLPTVSLAALKRMNAATRGDGSVDEAVFDGLELALPAASGAPTRDHLDWPTGRAGDLATKLLVLLGDAPDHARDLDRANALAKLAKEQRITIATVAIDRPGALSQDELARYRDQWRTLAEGSYRPLDKTEGFARPIGPIAVSLDGGDSLADRLQSLIDDRVEQARTLAALATAEAEGKLVEYVDSRGLTLDKVAPVLVDLHRGEAAKVARPDPRFDGKKAPSVRRGWIAESLGGRPMVTVEILMAPGELKALISELTQLQRAASGTARDLSELLQVGTAAATGETSFLEADRGSRTFAEHLRRRQGLPPPRPGSLLGRSQADLLRSDDLTLAALGAKLRESLLQLTRRLQAPDWQDPRRTIDGMALVPFESIDFLKDGFHRSLARRLLLDQVSSDSQHPSQENSHVESQRQGGRGNREGQGRSLAPRQQGRGRRREGRSRHQRRRHRRRQQDQRSRPARQGRRPQRPTDRLESAEKRGSLGPQSGRSLPRCHFEGMQESPTELNSGEPPSEGFPQASTKQYAPNFCQARSLKAESRGERLDPDVPVLDLVVVILEHDGAALAFLDPGDSTGRRGRFPCRR